ncbi:hypothetical protein AB0F30_17040 [Streptomyces sp. NPDC029006]|uniref:hypothetical protein n=1 Tax=Streptomyces sp. NPDC029006 TaxID=3155467 RepID=UPI0034079BD8
MDIGRELNRINQRLTKVERSPRLSHASIENTAVQVYDGAGSLRGVIGQQQDGTTGVNITNGPPPPQPSTPIVASVLGGVTVSWDGTFADGSVLPLDWARVEVHASVLASYEPVPATLQGTIETAQGATVVVPCDTPVYVRLVARNTSGSASTASGIVGPFGPAPVVADDILDGIVTTLKLAAGAVTEAKLAAGAVGTTALQDGAVLSAKLADAAVAVGKLADNAVTGPAIASGAVTAGKLAANSVVAGNIQAGAVTSATIAAGAITTDKLTVTGGANLLSDPSFEGAYSAALVSGSTSWSIDPTGNGSAKSLKVNAVAGAATTRSMKITTVPILPGDQLYLAADYLTSSDYTATAAVKLYARWEDSTGTTLSYGVAQASPPVLGGSTWTRISSTVTAPASTVQATIWVESFQASAGSVRWDNAAVRPVAGGTQIQDGAISTQKITALAITAALIAADAVAAGKIAADTVTAREIAALAVTTSKLDANAVTAGKILAGSVDATALAADAITGKTITGGTITGTTITGGTMQTATSGERISLNEANANKILLYASTGATVNELSARGLLVKGSSGAILWLNPSATYPQLKLYNAAGTNSAIVQVVENTTGDANLETISGAFSGSGYADMNWHTFMRNDGYVIERLRRSDLTTIIGGRVNLTASTATVGINNSDDTTQTTNLVFESNLAHLDNGRLQVLPPASINSVIYGNAATGHTGNLLRLSVNAADKATVDKDGNLTAAGTGTFTGGLTTAGNATVTGNLTVSGIGQRTTKRRTSDLSRSNTVTPTADTLITFTVDANATYVIDGYLKYSGASDILVGWTIPTGTNGEWQGLGNGITVISGTNTNATQQDATSTWGYTVRTESTDIANTRTYGGIGTTPFGIQIRGLIRVGATGGTFALAWAQGASSATATILYTDSHIRLEKVA